MGLASHLRRTFLAGIFAAIPLVVTVWVIFEVDRMTRGLTSVLTGREIPLLGIAIAVLGIYLLGWLVKSVLGRWFMQRVDRMLLRLPLLQSAYGAWKQVVVVQAEDSMYNRVVLIEDDDGRRTQLGFTNAKICGRDPERYCVYVPGAPNPLSGQIMFVTRERCHFMDLTADEVFKALLSSGNYLPEAVRLCPTNRQGQPS